MRSTPHAVARAGSLPVGLLAALLATVLTAGLVRPTTTAPLRSVIVTAEDGAQATVLEAVEAVGGRVERVLGIINGVAAEIPADRVTVLESTPGVTAVTPDRTLEPKGIYDGFDHAAFGGSMHRITGEVIEADELWKSGITGRGVDVALIDTGVAEVPGLTTPGKLVHGPDLSFESQSDETSHIDTYGHGTAMAGLIAGRDEQTVSPITGPQPSNFLGVAPGARIVSLKVGDRTGATDVSQVIAAIDWVVQHRNQHGLNIRVLNLSYGTDGAQDYTLDPLAYAAEVAWRKGIVVVTSAGNSGNGSPALDNPAYSPHVIAVGASDGKGTDGLGDDEVPAWSSCGDGTRNPDLVAPGAGIVGLRAPGSYLDETYPVARKSPLLFRGSGTSQSAAIVSGAVALLLQQRPELTPNDVKRVLLATTRPIKSTELRCQGSGQLRLVGTNAVKTDGTGVPRALSSGLGSLEQARGSYHVVERVTPDDGSEPYLIPLEGEIDIFGQPWDSARWSADSWNGVAWNAGTWNGTAWTGSDWDSARWSSARWSSARWSSARWSGSTWTSARWSTPEGWTAETGMSTGWTSARWSDSAWGSARWSDNGWSSSRWK